MISAAIPGIAQPSRYRQSAPVPATEIELAAFAFAILVLFGVILALVWNHFNARSNDSTSGARRKR